MLSRASVERLSSEMGRSGDECLATDRFRPTLLLDGCEPHEEDGWMNRTIAVGDAVIRVLAPDPRCAIVNQDPVTGEMDTDAGEVDFGLSSECTSGVLWGVWDCGEGRRGGGWR